MTRIAGAFVVILSLLICWPTPSAHAACHAVQQVQLVQGVAQVNTLLVCGASGATGYSGSDGPAAGGTQAAESEPIGQSPPRDSGLDAVCVREALSIGLAPFAFCAPPAPPVAPAAATGSTVAAPPVVTPGVVLAAFRRLPLPASDLIVQPPGGRTLVNFDTNFYTRNGELTRTVTLLGQRVELRIWPSAYTWRFGDGESRQTTSAGSPYPDLEITHRYLSKGRVAPSVDTTYAAEFSVNGGPWRAVDGTVTIPGAAEGLRVVTARPVLVGY